MRKAGLEPARLVSSINELRVPYCHQNGPFLPRAGSQTIRQAQRRAGDEQVVDQDRYIASCYVIAGRVGARYSENRMNYGL